MQSQVNQTAKTKQTISCVNLPASRKHSHQLPNSKFSNNAKPASRKHSHWCLVRYLCNNCCSFQKPSNKLGLFHYLLPENVSEKLYMRNKSRPFIEQKVQLQWYLVCFLSINELYFTIQLNKQFQTLVKILGLNQETQLIIEEKGEAPHYIHLHNIP